MSQQHVTRRLAVILIGFVLGGTIGFPDGLPVAEARVEGNTIVLGAALSFSGRYSTNGINIYNGYELAVERINAAGGVKVGGKKYKLRIIYYDDESNPARSAKLAERMIKRDGVKYMLGPYSSELTKAVARVTERYKIPMVEGGGASPSLFSRGNKYIFGVLSTAEHYMVSVIELAAKRAREAGKNPKDLTLAIAVENDRFSLYVRAAVLKDARKYGVKVIIDDKLPRVIKDMSETLKKVRKQIPDILVISGHSMGAEIAARQIKEMKIHVPVIAMTHCEAAKIIQKFGRAVEGFYCPAQWAPAVPYRDNLFGTAMDFSDAFKKAYADEKYVNVPYQAASAAVAVMVWKDAIERANSFDTEELRAALAATDLETFYGRVRFQANGAIDSDYKPMILRQIQNGRFVVVAPTVTPAVE